MIKINKNYRKIFHSRPFYRAGFHVGIYFYVLNSVTVSIGVGYHESCSNKISKI